MNVTLVLPPAGRVAEKKDTPLYQHVGLGYLAAVLEESGFYVKVINAKLERKGFEETLRAIKLSRPDVLGITAMTHEIDMAARLAEETKKGLPAVFTAVGGVHISALPAETLYKYGSFDLGVIGEGEVSFPNAVRMIEKGDFDFSRLKGVVYRKGPEVAVSRPAEWIADLDKLPFPAWRHFPRATEYSIITARGCPFSCVFCMQAMGHRVRRRSAGNVVGEIERVVAQRRPERFHFRDETFTLERARVFEICDRIIERGLNKQIRWTATTRVNCVERKMLLRMKEAGCDHIEFGIESGNQNVLDRIRKEITLREAENAVALAKETGIHIEGAFILGHPHETLESAYETIHFAAKLNPDLIQLGIMVPYPGTEVGRMAREGKGGYRIISLDWSDYNKQLGKAMEMEGLNRSDLERLQLAGYLKVFIFNRRLKDLLLFIWNYRREMVSFLKNHLGWGRPREKRGRLNMFLLLKIVFSRSPNIKMIVP